MNLTWKIIDESIYKYYIIDILIIIFILILKVVLFYPHNYTLKTLLLLPLQMLVVSILPLLPPCWYDGIVSHHTSNSTIDIWHSQEMGQLQVHLMIMNRSNNSLKIWNSHKKHEMESYMNCTHMPTTNIILLFITSAVPILPTNAPFPSIPMAPTKTLCILLIRYETCDSNRYVTFIPYSFNLLVTNLPSKKGWLSTT